MAVGDTHTFDGYAFTETLHGPNVERQCVVCGKRAYATPDCPEPYCQPCLQHLHGVKAPMVRVLGERPRSKQLRAGPGLAEARAQEGGE